MFTEGEEMIEKLEQLDSKLSSVATDLDDLNRKHNELVEKIDKLHMCASAKEWSWVQSKVDKLENKFNGHRHMQGLTLPERDELLKKIDKLENLVNITYEAGMNLETKDVASLHNRTNSLEARFNDLQSDSNIHIQRIDLGASEIVEHNKRLNTCKESIDELGRLFDDHINPDFIINRFKEEILKCLEDPEFRIKIQLMLGVPDELHHSVYTTTAETPPDKRFGTWFGDYGHLNANACSFCQGSGVTQPLINNCTVDTNKTIDFSKPPNQWCETGSETGPLYENTVKSDTPNETGKLVDSIIHKLDTADLDIYDTFLVFLTIPERIWLRKLLKEDKR